MVKIRPMLYADIPTAAVIAEAAFGSPGSRVDDLRRLLYLQPDGWIMAEKEGRPIGMVGAVDFGAFAWVGMMVVLPEEQGQGIGRKLMEHLLGWLDQRGVRMVRLDASKAGAPLYQKLGFEQSGIVRQFIQAGQPLLDYELSCVHPLDPADLDRVIDYDAAIFGTRREEMLKLYFRDFVGRSLVSFNEKGEISGYLFAQQQKLGPWMASTIEDARALLGAAQAMRFVSVPAAIVPDENLQAEKLLREAGFVEKQTHIHMRRGGQSLPGKRKLIYGQASYSLG